MRLLESTACALILGMIAAAPAAAADSDASRQSAPQAEASGPEAGAQGAGETAADTAGTDAGEETAETGVGEEVTVGEEATEADTADKPVTDGEAATAAAGESSKTPDEDSEDAQTGTAAAQQAGDAGEETAEAEAAEGPAETDAADEPITDDEAATRKADAADEPRTHLDAVLQKVQKRLTASFRADSETEREQDEHGALVEFYAEHEHAPLWVDEGGLNARARTVVKELAAAADYGLNPDDYARPAPDAAPETERVPAAELAEAEITLSRSVLAYARDARGGRLPPQSLSEYLDPTLDLPDPLEVMETVAERGEPASYLRGFHPDHEQFEALRQALLEMRGSAPGEQVHVPDGPILRAGDEHAQVAVVRERLQAPAAEGAAERFDAGLETAVREFQKARRLKVDGIVGPATRRAMNRRPENRERTILANMERWRWLPDNVDETFNVRVNIPEFTIRVFEDSKAIHSERVVVGTVENQTPVFSDEMERIVFFPYWNVPNSIKVEEILPNLRRRTRVRRSGFGFFNNVVSTQGNPRWMARNNLRIKYNGRRIDSTEVDWNRVDIRKFHFYQPPGEPNVLGVVKFMFPNKHAVYMHDTPSKHLFNQSVRAESHGCMRVRNPDRLAEILLSRDAGWSRGRVHSAMANENHRPVQLNKPVPVHTTYFTARVEDDGSVRYINDLYGHDARMARALDF